MKYSPLQAARYEYNPKLPQILRGKIDTITLHKGAATAPATDNAAIEALFPHTYGLPAVSFIKGDHAAVSTRINVGVILSGGQAPGGHNVISGLFDALKTRIRIQSS